MDGLIREITRAYLGWRLLQGKRIDSYATSEKPLVFSDEGQVLGKFIELNRSFKASSLEMRLIKAKLIASVYFLRNRFGERTPFQTYVRKTIGITPKPIPEPTINSARQEITASLHRKRVAVQREDLVRRLKLETRKLVSRACDYLGMENTLEVKFAFVEEDSYWTYYLDMDKGNPTLKINSRRLGAIDQDTIRYAVMHEICGHALQLASWLRNARLGKISRVCQFQDDFGPEIFMLEGVAEAMPYFIFKEYLGQSFSTMLSEDELAHMVQNNAYIRINSGEPIEIVADYYVKNVPDADRKETIKALAAARDDPLTRCYRYVYWPSLSFFKAAALKLDEAGSMTFLRRMFKGPMTYTQIDSFYKGLLRTNTRNPKADRKVEYTASRR